MKNRSKLPSKVFSDRSKASSEPMMAPTEPIHLDGLGRNF